MTEKIKATWYTLGSPYDQSNRDQTRRMMCAVEKARAEHQVNIDVEFSRYAPMMTWRPCLELKAHKTFYLHYTNLSDFCGEIVSIRRQMREHAIDERKKIMAEKNVKCCQANQETASVAKVPNKKETKALVKAAASAVVTANTAIGKVRAALIARGDLKENCALVKKLEKADAIDSEFFGKVKELGY